MNWLQFFAPLIYVGVVVVLWAAMVGFCDWRNRKRPIWR